MSEPVESPAPAPVLYRGLKRMLDRAGADRAAVIVALVLLCFSLDTGLSADDYVHELIARGSDAIPGFIRAPWDMYRFADKPFTAMLMREGVLGWWEDPDAKLAFFRPLSALTHILDSALWPNSGVLMHLHTLFPVVVTPEDVAHGKPAPDMFLLAAQKMGVPPAKCLVFEDAVPGIQAAEAAGMKWVRVPSRA